jgi:hypothetical protein
MKEFIDLRTGRPGPAYIHIRQIEHGNKQIRQNGASQPKQKSTKKYRNIIEFRQDTVEIMFAGYCNEMKNMQ